MASDLASMAIAFVLALAVTGCSSGIPDSTRSESPAQSGFGQPAGTLEVEADSCIGEGYSIEFPRGWFVHPPDDTMGISGCSLFAAEQFDGELEPDGGWTGAQIVLRSATGCQGSFEIVLTQDELEIQGFPAWRRELAAGEGESAGDPTAYAYTVNLAPGRPCEGGRWFFGRTELDAPGDHMKNRTILDEMMESVEFLGA